jgi:hypothetical protein
MLVMTLAATIILFEKKWLVGVAKQSKQADKADRLTRLTRLSGLPALFYPHYYCP